MESLDHHHRKMKVTAGVINSGRPATNSDRPVPCLPWVVTSSFVLCFTVVVEHVQSQLTAIPEKRTAPLTHAPHLCPLIISIQTQTWHQPMLPMFFVCACIVLPLFSPCSSTNKCTKHFILVLSVFVSSMELFYMMCVCVCMIKFT